MRPPKRYFVLSLLCMTTAVIAVLTLMIISTDNDSRKGDFKRNFICKTPVLLYHSKKMKGLRTICGIQENQIYLETDSVGNIIETDSTLSNKRLLKIGIPDRKTVQSLYTTCVDSSYCYIMAGNVPEIIRYHLDGLSYQIFHFPKKLFSESLLVGDNDYVLRAYQKFKSNWDQVFIRWNPVKHILLTQENVPAKRGDAGFSTDGMLLFDRSTKHILYVEYYNNQFICLDTILHVLYKGQTIDTISNTAIKVSSETTPYSKTITNASPLHEINLESNAVNDKLYIHSATPAKNESSKEFRSNAVIDVYSISDRHYLGSFYIPEYKEERLKDFELAADKLIVLYANYVVVYSIPLNL
ncbi:MAG TPA: hypothetical protein VFI29_07450 [Hanamia sp.]|nr:hypothetical protein [Hanamia sp.]